MNTLTAWSWQNKLSEISDEVVLRVRKILPFLKKHQTGLEISVVVAAIEALLVEEASLPVAAGFTAVFTLSTGVPMALVHYLEKKNFL